MAVWQSVYQKNKGIDYHCHRNNLSYPPSAITVLLTFSNTLKFRFSLDI